MPDNEKSHLFTAYCKTEWFTQSLSQAFTVYLMKLKEEIMKTLNKTITFVIVLTFLISTGAPFGSAATDEFLSPQLKAAISVDADTFINSSSDYLKNWEGIPARIQGLKAKANPTAAEINVVRTDLLNLKRLLNTMKTSLTAVINKLKGANKYIEQDNFVLNSVRSKNAGAAGKLQSEGGAHNILDGTSNITEQLNRVDQFLADPIFRRNTASFHLESDNNAEFKIVRASYTTGAAVAPVFRLSFTCLVLGSRLIIKTIKGTDTQRDADQFVNNCSGQ
jgi:hypothetical protein